MDQVHVVVAVAMFTVAALGLVSARIQTLPLSQPLVALAIGVAAGPEVLGWLRPERWGDFHLILKEAARFTLAISVVGIALRVPTRDLRRLLRPVLLLLTLGMLLMWGVSSGVAYLLLGVPPVLALLIGAAVTPTDPVVASSIVTGRAAERTLPNRTRATLSAESGANDGLAYLIVMLPVMALTTGGPMAGEWIVEVLLQGVLFAILIGCVAGALTGALLRRADAAGWVAGSSILGFSIALSLLAVAGARLAGSDGILAAFAAGLAFNAMIDRNEEEDEGNVQEAISKLFSPPVFVLLGATLPWAEWFELGIAGPVMAAAVLILRRPLTLLLLGPLLGGGLRRQDTVFLGWFGPIGIAAIYYALHGMHETGQTRLWAAASLVVALSVVAHGVTAGPGLRLYSRARAKGEDQDGLAGPTPARHPRIQDSTERPR